MHDPELYGHEAADAYDRLYGGLAGTETAVATLAELAAGGPVLELGIGTGRLALPLKERGLEVHGIESSQEMADALARKPGGAEIAVALGDFAAIRLQRSFSLAFLAFNTIFAPPTQAGQVEVFANAARHLQPGGRFAIEAFVLDGTEAPEPKVRPRNVGPAGVELQVYSYDAASQRLETVLVHLGDEEVELIPANHRYASPAELDLMAQLVGLVPEERWAGWDRSPFEHASRKHISIYRRP